MDFPRLRGHRTRTSTGCVASLALLLIVYRLPLASIMLDLIIWLHAQTFYQSQFRCNAMRLLGRSEFTLIACYPVTLRRNVRADRDVCIVITRIIRYYMSQTRQSGPVNQALVDTKAVMNASSAPIANVQNVLEEVAPVKVLLATAWINLYIPEGRYFKVRALLD